jgi:hypothetical protein
LQLEVGYGTVGTADTKVVRSVLCGKNPSTHQEGRCMHYVPHRASSNNMENMGERKMEGEEVLCVAVEVRRAGKW